MSAEKTEWKTIRIDAATYSKISQLSGLWTFIFGNQVSLSTLAQWAIFEYFRKHNSGLRDTISDDDKLDEYRKTLKGHGWFDRVKLEGPDLIP